MGILPEKEIVHWHVPGPETSPQPQEGEVVIFTDHLLHGFSPPGSKIFRDVLHFFKIRPQDIAPNSVTNLCQFQVLCEAYLQEEPTVNMFRDFYYLNRQTEVADGPLFELGGISIQRRRDITFPSAILPSHLKDWNRTWFYCKNTAPADENPLPGYRPHRLNPNDVLPSKLTATERAQHAHIFPKIKALIANGLTGIDLTRCWVSWRILPLSRWAGLMCEYDGSVNNPQRFNKTPLSDKEINAIVKTLLGESQEACSKVGLNPFCALNRAPAVNIFTSYTFYNIIFHILSDHTHVCRATLPSGRKR
jgi:hypothetical protein